MQKKVRKRQIVDNFGSFSRGKVKREEKKGKGKKKRGKEKKGQQRQNCGQKKEMGSKKNILWLRF